jgi:transposase
MARHGLSDEEWVVIEGLFPRPKSTGRPPMPARRAFEGVCWILRAGAPWRDLPEELGPWETVYAHFNRWTSDGTLVRVLTRLKERFSADDRFDHGLWSIDGSVVRAHRCAAGGGKKGRPTNRPITPSAAPAGVSRRKSTWSATGRAHR